MLERGWLAGGNMARNTTVIRSNYLWDESAAIYEHSLKLWEGLAEELDYDILFSQRGVLNLAHSLGDMREGRRRVNANQLNGIDAEWLTPEEVKAFCPIVNISPDVRYPVMGGTLQRRGGIAKHDYVAWAFARKADEMGVDLIQNCEVTGFDLEGGRVVGADEPRSDRRRARLPLCGRGSQHGPRVDGRPRSSDPEPPAPGAGVRAARTGPELRRDVERGPRLRQPGAQGRAGHGRRDRPL